MNHIISSGEVSSGVSLCYDSMYVSSGGTAIDTVIASRGRMEVSSGGSAVSTIVSSGGTMLVSSGASASAIREAGGFVYASDSTNVNFIPNVFSCVISNGGATVHSGTLASSATVASSGSMIVSSGGSASATLVSGWYAKLLVFSGGAVTSTAIVSAGSLVVASSGLAVSTTIDRGELVVSNSGMVSSTTVNSSGWVMVYSGGSASSTVVNAGGCMFVSSGGSASWIRENGGLVSVASGADVHFVTNVFSGVVSSGSATAHSGTTAYRVTVDDFGRMLISSGGTASSTTVSGRGASLQVLSGGMATSTTIDSSCNVAVSSGGTMASTDVKSYGLMTIAGSGTASSTTVSGCSAKLQICSRGTATSTTIESGASAIVSSGGSALVTTISSGGSLVISGGGTATETIVHSGGSMSVSSGGSALRIRESGGCVAIADGATASFVANVFSGVTLDDHHLATLHSGTTATSTTIGDDGRMAVFSGGAARETLMHGGDLQISGGGNADQTTVVNGNMTVSYGGVAAVTTLRSGGSMVISSGGTASATTVDFAGNLIVCGGGTAAGISAAQGAILCMTVTADTYAAGTFSGSAFQTVNGCLLNYSVQSACELTASRSGTVSRTTVSGDGSMSVADGGIAVETVVSSKGNALAFLGGTVCGMHVLSGGSLTASYGISAAGIAIDHGAFFTLTAAPNTNVAGTVNGSAFEMKNGTIAGYTVRSGCALEVLSGGTAAATKVECDGKMHVSGGGIQRGKLSIATQNCVFADFGAVFDFTLDESARSTPLIDRWDYISGGNQASYTVTPAADQCFGKYLLAGGATDFSCSVTLRDDQEQVFATISVGEAVVHQGKRYQLVKDSGELSIQISDVLSAVSDYNRSGKSDMVQFVDGLVYVTHDTPSGYVQTPAINDVSGWSVTEFRRDLTGDGYADIQITAYDGASQTWVATLRNDYFQTGCVTLNYQFIGAYETKLWSYLGSADFNGDGKSEILMIQTEAGKDSCGHRNVVGWITDATTCKWTGNIWLGALDDNWNITGTADVTGDGADNVLLRRADGMIGYWDKAGTNNIVALQNAGDRILLTTGDFDGDGAQDFLWKSLVSDEFSTWTNINGVMSDTLLGRTTDLCGNWSFAGVGDYNGDDKDEILWCDTTTYRTAYGGGSKAKFAELTVIV